MNRARQVTSPILDAPVKRLIRPDRQAGDVGYLSPITRLAACSLLLILPACSSGGQTTQKVTPSAVGVTTLAGRVETAVEHVKQTDSLCAAGDHAGVDIESASGTVLAVAPLVGWDWVALGDGGYYDVFSCQATFRASAATQSIYRLHVEGSDASKDKTIDASRLTNGEIPLFDG